MAQSPPSKASQRREALAAISEEDRKWLAERLVEYRDFLEFLRANLRLPPISIVVAINRSVRHDDEWFEEPDELERIERILEQLESETDPVIAAAQAIGRIARSQAFTEGNKRTALLVGRWILDGNGVDGRRFIPDHDDELGSLLVSAARGLDEIEHIAQLFDSCR